MYKIYLNLKIKIKIQTNNKYLNKNNYKLQMD